jgi:hypothetical protein
MVLAPHASHDGRERHLRQAAHPSCFAPPPLYLHCALLWALMQLLSPPNTRDKVLVQTSGHTINGAAATQNAKPTAVGNVIRLSFLPEEGWPCSQYATCIIHSLLGPATGACSRLPQWHQPASFTRTATEPICQSEVS